MRKDGSVYSAYADNFIENGQFAISAWRSHPHQAVAYDLVASGVHIVQGIDIQVEFSGLTVKSLSGTVISGSIDRATMGVAD